MVEMIMELIHSTVNIGGIVMQKGFYILFVAFFIISSLLFSGCGKNSLNDMNVEFLRQGSFQVNPTIKVGNAFDQFFTNGKWHSFKSTDGARIVEFSGDIVSQESKAAIAMLQITTGNLNSNFKDSTLENQNKSMKVVVQFIINGQNFDTQYLEIDGSPMNQLMILSMIEKILSDYRMVPAR